MTCTPCLNGRHVRCTDRVSCSCQMCNARPMRVRAEPPVVKPKAPVKPRVYKPRPKVSDSNPAGRPSKAASWSPEAIMAFRVVAVGRSISAMSRAYHIDRRTVRKLLGEEVVRAPRRRQEAPA